VNFLNWFRDASIKRKLLVIGLLTPALSLFFFTVLLTLKDVIEWRTRAVAELTSYAQIIGSNAAPALMFDDRKAAAETLSALAAKQDINHAILYDKNGKLFAGYQRTRNLVDPLPDIQPGSYLFTPHSLFLAQSVYFKREPLGKICMEYELGSLYAGILRSIGLMLLTGLGVFLLAALLFARLQKIFVAPILDMGKVMKEVIGTQNFAVRVEDQGRDEIGMLARTLNQMLGHIESRDAQLADQRLNLEDKVERRTAELRDNQRRLERELAGRERNEQELRIAATAFETQEGIMVVRPDNRILRVNHAFTRITGYSAEEVIGLSSSLLRSDRHDSDFYKNIKQILDRDRCWQGEIWHRRKNGEVYPEWLSVTAVRNVGSEITHYVFTFSDITARKAAEDQIHQLAFYDPLTNLPNRRLLLDRLQHALASGLRSPTHGALLFIDLDNFKTLNDTQGHAVGDLLLIEVARRLQACVRVGDNVARLGGDEFVVMLENLSEDAEQAGVQATVAAEKIRDSLGQPYLLDDFEHHCSCSIGISMLDGDAGIDEVLKRADTAMYHAKSSGRNALRFFDPAMQAALEARASLEADLRYALQRQQFKLYFQPQLNAQYQIIGAEVLLRWIHPERGMVSPLDFIPLAEENGMILPIGQWVLETACAQLKVWEGNPLTSELQLAVNVSARQFYQPDFIDKVYKVLNRTAIEPYRLELELTESMVLNDIDASIAAMQVLKQMGVTFSMDDFGTGYSSLAYLTQLPLDQLKIDQAFVRNMTTKRSDAIIVQTIINMGNSLAMEVIAEGVETLEQRDLLAKQGCHAFQGYLFSKPVLLEQFEALLQHTA